MREIKRVTNEWADKNRLSYNVIKTNIMLILARNYIRAPNIILIRETLKLNDKIEYLAVMIDLKLLFQE